MIELIDALITPAQWHIYLTYHRSLSPQLYFPSTSLPSLERRNIQIEHRYVEVTDVF